MLNLLLIKYTYIYLSLSPWIKISAKWKTTKHSSFVVQLGFL